MDLFCGTGSIGLTLAQHCQHVYGFEVAASSIADAKQNAAMNNISNATFVQSDLTKVSASMGKHYPKPDVIVTGKPCHYHAAAFNVDTGMSTQYVQCSALAAGH